MMDPDGAISFWNEAAARMFGYTREEVIGAGLHELLGAPRHLEQFHSAFARFQRTGQGAAVGKTIQLEAVRKGGKEFTAELSLAALRLEGQWNAVAVLRDVSERNRAETELRRVRRAVESASDAIVLMDRQGTVTYLNPAAVAISGYTAESINALGGPVALAANPETATRISTAIREGRPWTGELELRARDARIVSLLWQASTITDERQEVVGFVAVGRDIRERKCAEEAIRQHAAALEAANRALAEATRVAETATRAKSAFLANMSHELRTPLTAILGFAETLRGGRMSPAQEEYAIQTIHRNGKHLLQLIDDVLDLSKIEAGKVPVELVWCTPAEILAGVESMMRGEAVVKGLSFCVQYDGLIPERIQSDPTRLRQILVNLVGNAVRFTEVGGVRLHAQLDRRSDGTTWLECEVIDTGIGMTEEQLEHIFQPFTQADTTISRRFGGSGLGLAISRGLAEALGGTITAESKLGLGSVFTLSIPTGPLEGVPLVECGGTAVAESTWTEDDDPPETETRLCGRVLLAEDGPDNRNLISFILRKAGAAVCLAENGRIACDLVARAHAEGKPFDMVLMDVQMPVLDGYAATRELRQAGWTLPIVALTAHAMSDDRQKALDAGCDDYASKPIHRAHLIELVRKYLLVAADQKR